MKFSERAPIADGTQILPGSYGARTGPWRA